MHWWEARGARTAKGKVTRFLAVVLCMLSGCIESARSADVAPELAPRIASSAAISAKHDDDEAPRADTLAVNHASRADTLAAAPVTELDPAANLAQEESNAAIGFFDSADGPIREALSKQEPMRIERGRGGRSLGFKITLEGGQKGYFKGEQQFSAANWFGEVASYHLDRMLGLGRVPAVVSRQFPWSRLEPAAGKDPRKAEIIVHNGQLRGAFVAWVTGNLKPLKHAEGWERWIRVRYWPSTAVSPFQRPAVWKRELDQVRRFGDDWRAKGERLRRRNLRPEPDRDDRPAELSDLVVFDYLTRNLDRWGGGNANVLTRDERGPLIFLDNGASFEPGEARPSLMEARLHVVQRFRRSTIAAVRAFDLKRFEARLATEPVQPVLNRQQLNGLDARRKGLLEWVAQMEAEHGEAIWAWE